MVIINTNEKHSKSKDGAYLTDKTTIQLSPETRDRLYRLKFRRTYDQFLNELCDLYEEQGTEPSS